MNVGSVIVIVLLISSSCIGAQTLDGEWLNFGNGNDITALLETEDNLYVGTRGNGLLKIDKSSNTRVWFKEANSDLPSNNIRSVFRARNGDIWVAAYGGGLALLQGDALESLTTENSALPSNLVCDIVQDRNNTIWIATWSGGLASLAGGEWTILSTANSDIADDRIGRLALDSAGRIVMTVFTDTHGIAVSALDRGVWTHHPASFTDGPGLSPESIGVDADGNVWVGGTNADVYRYDGEQWSKFEARWGLSGGVVAPRLPVLSIHIDDLGRVWVGGPGGAGVYDAGAWESFTAENSTLPQTGVTAIAGRSDGRMWLGTSTGISSTSGGEWDVILPSDSKVPSDVISDIAISAEGTVWASGGGSGGLAAFDGGEWREFTSENSALPARRSITSLTIDPNKGHIWAAIRAGLVHFDGEKLEVLTPDDTDQAPIDRAGDLAADGDGGLWIARPSQSEALVRFDGTSWQAYGVSDAGFNFQQMFNIIIGPDGALWCSATPGGIIRFDGSAWSQLTKDNSGLPLETRLGPLAFDSEGSLWVAAEEGVARYDFAEWTLFAASESNPYPHHVSAIAAEPGGNIWFAGQNVVRFDGTRWQSYEVENSPLYGPPFNAIAADQSGAIWIGSSHGGLHYVRSTGITSVSQQQSGAGDVRPAIRIQPNPASEMLTVKLPACDGAVIQLYDLRGNRLAELPCDVDVNASSSAGELYLKLPLNTYAPGVYLLRYVSRDRTLVRRVVVRR